MRKESRDTIGCFLIVSTIVILAAAVLAIAFRVFRMIAY